MTAHYWRKNGESEVRKLAEARRRERTASANSSLVVGKTLPLGPLFLLNPVDPEP
jgi:hypothetical protein